MSNPIVYTSESPDPNLPPKPPMSEYEKTLREYEPDWSDEQIAEELAAISYAEHFDYDVWGMFDDE